MRYSFLRLAFEAMRQQRGWTRAWRAAAPQAAYDIVIVGGGGHGLATAFSLAQHHPTYRIAVVEKGWIGGGNVGRNTTIVRSNYLLAANIAFYEWSLRLWERLEQDLNYNVMFSQRGVLNLYHSDAQGDEFARRGNAMRLGGADAELLSAGEVRRRAPYLAHDNGRYPILGGLLQPRAGTARHDAVAWGYARAASALGVDIIENCEVRAIERDSSGAICALHTSRGRVAAERVGLAVAGNSSRVARLADLRLPIESHVLQAFVSEAVKPVLPCVVTFGAGHFYVSQSDKGGLVFGGDLDGYNSYAQRGGLGTAQDVCEAGMAMMPMIGRARILRSWGGVVDMSMDGSPIIDRTPVPGLYLNAGWCYGGFKATPASGAAFAHLLATDRHHDLASCFRLDRFAAGRLLDEKGQGAQPNLH